MKRIVLYGFISITIFACANKEKEQEDKIGKYVYLDKDSTLHIRERCVKFILGENKDYGVVRILSDEITKQDIKKTCNYCVNDNNYDRLKEMAK